MKKLVLVAKVAALIVLSFLLSYIFLELRSEDYTKAVESYPSGSTALTLSDVSPGKQSDTLNALIRYAGDHGLFVVRADQLISNDGPKARSSACWAGRVPRTPRLLSWAQTSSTLPSSIAF